MREKGSVMEFVKMLCPACEGRIFIYYPNEHEWICLSCGRKETTFQRVNRASTTKEDLMRIEELLK